MAPQAPRSEGVSTQHGGLDGALGSYPAFLTVQIEVSLLPLCVGRSQQAGGGHTGGNPPPQGQGAEVPRRDRGCPGRGLREGSSSVDTATLGTRGGRWGRAEGRARLSIPAECGARLATERFKGATLELPVFAPLLGVCRREDLRGEAKFAEGRPQSFGVLDTKQGSSDLGKTLTKCSARHALDPEFAAGQDLRALANVVPTGPPCWQHPPTPRPGRKST